MPTVKLRWARKPLARVEGRKFKRSAAASTSARVAALTYCLPLIALDAVATDTRAARATSTSVAIVDVVDVLRLGVVERSDMAEHGPVYVDVSFHHAIDGKMRL